MYLHLDVVHPIIKNRFLEILKNGQITFPFFPLMKTMRKFKSYSLSVSLSLGLSLSPSVSLSVSLFVSLSLSSSLEIRIRLKLMLILMPYNRPKKNAQGILQQYSYSYLLVKKTLKYSPDSKLISFKKSTQSNHSSQVGTFDDITKNC